MSATEMAFAAPREPASFRTRATAVALRVAPLGFAALAYFPIVYCYFYADDFLNLFQIANESVGRYLITPHGGHVLVVRNALFYLTASLFGPDPAPFYWSVLPTHLLNVWLLFSVLVLLTGSRLLACFGAALWGASPVLEGTLGWYSVYGQVIVGTVLLVMLRQAVAVGAADRPPTRWMERGWYLLAMIAATSFGTGIGIALVWPLVAGVLLPRWRARWPPLVTLPAALLLVYAGLALAYKWVAGAPPFVPPVGLAAWTPIVGFFVHLLGFGFAQLLFGYYEPTWLLPPVWLGLLGGLVVAALFTLWASPEAVRRRVIALSLLLVACYGIIAVGRGGMVAFWNAERFMESTRYHYVGQLILTMLLCVLLARLPAPRAAWLRSAALVAWFAIALVGWARHAPLTDYHVADRRITEETIAAMRAAIAAEPVGSTVRIRNRPFEPLPLPAPRYPGWAATFAIFFPENTVDGRKVVFVDYRKRVRDGLAYGRRTSTLLVPPAPQAPRAQP